MSSLQLADRRFQIEVTAGFGYSYAHLKTWVRIALRQIHPGREFAATLQSAIDNLQYLYASA